MPDCVDALASGKSRATREHQRNRVLGSRDRIAERRVHHNDAPARGGGNVDIVDADAGAANHFEIGRGSDQLLGDFRRRADGEAVVAADDFEKCFLVLAQIGQIVDRDTAILENLDGGRGKLV